MNLKSNQYKKLGEWFVNQVKSQENYQVAINSILSDEKGAYTFSAKLFTSFGVEGS